MSHPELNKKRLDRIQASIWLVGSGVIIFQSIQFGHQGLVWQEITSASLSLVMWVLGVNILIPYERIKNVLGSLT